MKDFDYYSKCVDVAKTVAYRQQIEKLVHFSDTHFDNVKSQSQELFYATKFFEDKIKEHNSKIRASIKKIESIRIRYEYQYVKVSKSTYFKNIDFRKIEKTVSENPEKDWHEIASMLTVQFS